MRLVLVVLVVVAALATAAPASTSIRPSLRLVSEAPFALAGTGFEASELVTVRATTRGFTVTKLVRASAGGRLAVRFPVTPMCGAFTVWAVGALGSRAGLRRAGHACAGE